MLVIIYRPAADVLTCKNAPLSLSAPEVARMRMRNARATSPTGKHDDFAFRVCNFLQSFTHDDEEAQPVLYSFNI
jgi:hypothetical protein